MWYLNQFLVVTYCTIILDILRKLLHILYATWHFIEPIHQQSCHLCNAQYLFLYWACKLLCVWLTANFRLVNPYMQMYLRRTLRFFWQHVHAQDADYCTNIHTGVQTFIFLVVFIPEDNLTYRPLRCNSIHIFFLN